MQTFVIRQFVLSGPIQKLHSKFTMYRTRPHCIHIQIFRKKSCPEYAFQLVHLCIVWHYIYDILYICDCVIIINSTLCTNCYCTAVFGLTTLCCCCCCCCACRDYCCVYCVKIHLVAGLYCSTTQ